MNTIVVLHHFVYILISAGLTIWVGRTLFKSGQVFLVDAFNGNEKIAASVNHLLVVGFYLINFGIVSLFLNSGAKPTNIVDFIELMSIKVGGVFILLGLMHFGNLFVFKIFNLAAGFGKLTSGTKPKATTPAPAGDSRYFSAAR